MLLILGYMLECLRAFGGEPWRISLFRRDLHKHRLHSWTWKHMENFDK